MYESTTTIEPSYSAGSLSSEHRRPGDIQPLDPNDKLLGGDSDAQKLPDSGVMLSSGSEESDTEATPVQPAKVKVPTAFKDTRQQDGAGSDPSKPGDNIDRNSQAESSVKGDPVHSVEFGAYREKCVHVLSICTGQGSNGYLVRTFIACF
ncbi:hypothetical protein BJV82DRAFT_579336 [Fennellomyces sp. T-0311]|nr:hypothetical protein BJV82DRAFT_579336 [Fennellomyces sp. T-0311]